MAEFLLQPCHVREDSIVPSKKGPVSFSWTDLSSRLAPSKTVKAKQQLRALKTGSFVGLTKTSHGPSNFVLSNDDGTGKIGWILKKDPSFKDRLVEVYRVERIQWDDKIKEQVA